MTEMSKYKDGDRVELICGPEMTGIMASVIGDTGAIQDGMLVLDRLRDEGKWGCSDRWIKPAGPVDYTERDEGGVV